MKNFLIAMTALAFATPALAAELPPLTKKPGPPVDERHYHFTEGVQCPAVGPTPCVGKTVKLDNHGF